MTVTRPGAGQESGLRIVGRVVLGCMALLLAGVGYGISSWSKGAYPSDCFVRSSRHCSGGWRPAVFRS